MLTLIRRIELAGKGEGWDAELRLRQEVDYHFLKVGRYREPNPEEAYIIWISLPRKDAELSKV